MVGGQGRSYWPGSGARWGSDPPSRLVPGGVLEPQQRRLAAQVRRAHGRGQDPQAYSCVHSGPRLLPGHASWLRQLSADGDGPRRRQWQPRDSARRGPSLVHRQQLCTQLEIRLRGLAGERGAGCSLRHGGRRSWWRRRLAAQRGTRRSWWHRRLATQRGTRWPPHWRRFCSFGGLRRSDLTPRLSSRFWPCRCWSSAF